MLNIWGRISSINVRKVVWCAQELGLDFQRTEAGGAYGVVQTPEYLALNPNAMVPTLNDDGFVLWESNTIVRYHTARYGSDTSWYPTDARVRAQADKWMDWTTSSFAGPFRTVFWGVLRTPADKQDWPAINTAIKECTELLPQGAREPWGERSRAGRLACFSAGCRTRRGQGSGQFRPGLLRCAAAGCTWRYGQNATASRS